MYYGISIFRLIRLNKDLNTYPHNTLLMSLTNSHGEAFFSVDGSMVMGLARQAYWFEDRKDWAFSLFASLDGITAEQTMKVLTGDASIRGVDDIEYVDKPDVEFKASIEAHKAWLKEEAERQSAKNARVQNADVFRWDRIEQMEDTMTVMERATALREEMMAGRPPKPEVIVPPVDPVPVGDYMVERSMLNEYVYQFVENHFATPIGSEVLLRAARLHRENLRLRESIGLEGYWGTARKHAEPDAFDTALLNLCEGKVHSDKREAKHAAGLGCLANHITGITTFANYRRDVISRV